MTFDAVLRRMAAIHQAKNADYGSSYNLAPALLGIPAHVGILVRMTDKLARACKLAQGEKAQVQDEALTDTLLDLANYAVLAILALESPRGNGCKFMDHNWAMSPTSFFGLKTRRCKSWLLNR